MLHNALGLEIQLSSTGPTGPDKDVLALQTKIQLLIKDASYANNLNLSQPKEKIKD